MRGPGEEDSTRMSKFNQLGIQAIVFDVGGVLREARMAMELAYQRVLAKHAPHLSDKVDYEAVFRMRGLESMNAMGRSLEAIIFQAPMAEAVRLPATEGERLLQSHLERSWSALTPQDAIKMHELVRTMAASYKIEFASPDLGQYVTLMPHLKEDLDAMRTAGLRLGVLSNSTEKAVRRDLGDLDRYFDFLVCEAVKPSTERYLQALADSHLDPSHTAYVGDAASDVAMALEAGSIPIGVLSGMGTSEQLAEAALLFDNVHIMTNNLLH